MTECEYKKFIEENFNKMFSKVILGEYEEECENWYEEHEDSAEEHWPISASFVDVVNSYIDPVNIDSVVECFSNLGKEEGFWTAGASKFVWIPEDGDFVIKIVFDGDSIGMSECDIFSDAKANGLEKYFAEAYDEFQLPIKIEKEDGDEFDAYANTFSVYFQKRVVSNSLSRSLKSNYSFEEKNLSKSSRNINRVFSDKSNTNSSINGVFATDYYNSCISIMPPSEFFVLSRFLINESINDLHNGNFEIINGHPIFFDYSGFSWTGKI